jgi:hypothetical protein
MAGPYRTNARQATTEVENFGSKGGAALKSMGKVADGAADRFKALVKSVKATGPELATVAKVAEQELKRIQNAEAKAALGIGGGSGGGGGGRFGRRVGYWSMRNFSPVTPTLSIGKRIAGDIARGVGLKTDVSSYVQSFTERQKLATDIAASGYQPGAAGAAGVRQDPNVLMAEASKVGKATATDPQQALEGLQKFVAVTGDLETGRAVLGDMAKLAKATGSNLDTVIDAAGEISAKLGDIPDKANVINGVMRQIAGQGKLGAVEMRDFAAQLGKIASLAPQFKGNVQDNIGEMAILMQEARQHGGAANAAQAATGVRNFVATFTKGPRLEALARIGINPYHTTGTGKGTLKSPEEIIRESLRQTKGDQKQLYGKVFSDQRSQSVVRGFANIYNKAGGGKAGDEAVHAEFERLRKATMSQADVDKAAADAMQTVAAKAQLFQNELQDIADRTATKLIPALERAAPTIEKVADAFGSFVNWAAANPGLGIGAALTASIAKAGLENLLRAAVERSLGAGGGGPGGGAGALGKGVAVLGAAGLGAYVGDKIVENYDTGEQKSQSARASGTITSANALGSQNVGEVAAQIEATKSRLAHSGDSSTLNDIMGVITTVVDPKGAQEAAAAIQNQQARDAAEQAGLLRQLVAHMATLVAQGKGGGPVRADQTGRMPANGARGISYGGG